MVCDEVEVDGCMQTEACNYDADATNDVDCDFAVEGCSTCIDGASVDTDTDGDGVADCDEVDGCMQTEACNYDADATNDVDCDFAVEGCSTCIDGASVDTDTDGDGVADCDEVEGCMQTEACNYNADATNDDGSCSYYGNAEEVETSCITEDGEEGYYNSNCECAVAWPSVDELANAFIVYPNPVSGVLNVEFSATSNSDVTIQFVNSLGQMISSKDYVLTNGLLDISLDMGEYSKGIYHMNLISNKNVVSKTIIVK